MKTKINRFFLSHSNKMLLILLGILGFSISNCKKEELHNQATEYGTPSATYIVNGTIKSKLTNQPIKNIRTIIHRGYGDSTLSNQEGKFIISAHGSGDSNKETFSFSFKDIDDTLNGNYKNIDTTITFTNNKFTRGDGHWYKGGTQKDVEIFLEPKKK